MEGVLPEEDFFTLMAIGVLIMLALALAFVLFVNFSQKKILKKQMQIQKINLEHQQELLHATILTQEVERERIARDLHDEIGSKLNVIFLNMHRLKVHSKEPQEVSKITKEVSEVINTTIDSIRFISHELLPPTLEDFGLVQAIMELQHSFNTIGKVHIKFTPSQEVQNFKNKLIDLNLFRVLQELLNNSINHGKASEIVISLEQDNDLIKLKYHDNGSGFDVTNLKSHKGLGIKNIESRLRIINAQHSYQSSREKGTSVYISVPLEDH